MCRCSKVEGHGSETRQRQLQWLAPGAATTQGQGQADRPVLGLGNVGLCLIVSRDGRTLGAGTRTILSSDRACWAPQHLFPMPA